MYPGLFGEDSLITLGQARSGDITVWFTAWWVWLIKAFSLNTHAIPALTLAGVLIFTFSVRDWARAVLPAGAARTWAIVVLCATPLVGGLGIQVRHDAWMTSGFLLALAAVARASTNGRLAASDYIRLIAAVWLIPTRHNGLGTLIVTAVLCGITMPGNRRIVFPSLIAVAAGVFLVTQGATLAAGRPHSIDPAQAVEWMMADVSCLAADGAVQLTDAEWAGLEPIADKTDWPQPVACRFVSPLFIAPSFKIGAVEAATPGLVRTWLSLLRRHPLKLTFVHVRRVNLFLPPFVAGVPQQTHTPFIHSTILPNDFGLEWAWPRVAELARLPMRAWNALRAVLANAAIWLIVMAFVSWRRHDLRLTLGPTLAACVALELGLLATAPIAEGRYGLLILVVGQLLAVFLVFERWWASPSALKAA